MQFSESSEKRRGRQVDARAGTCRNSKTPTTTARDNEANMHSQDERLRRSQDTLT